MLDQTVEPGDYRYRGLGGSRRRRGEISLAALEAMVEGRFGHLPVVEDGKLVGMVTRRDIVPTRMRQLELERLQPG